MKAVWGGLQLCCGWWAISKRFWVEIAIDVGQVPKVLITVVLSVRPEMMAPPSWCRTSTFAADILWGPKRGCRDQALGCCWFKAVALNQLALVGNYPSCSWVGGGNVKPYLFESIFISCHWRVSLGLCEEHLGTSSGPVYALWRLCHYVFSPLYFCHCKPQGSVYPFLSAGFNSCLLKLKIPVW